MKKFLKFTKVFGADESGASMVEYGIALLVVAALGVGAMTILGGEVAANVTSACAAFGTATTAVTC